jgi:hypothetical protein
MVERLGVRALAKLAHHLDDVHPAACAQHPVDAGDLHCHFCTITLCETPRRDQDLIPALALCQFTEGMDGFFLGGSNKAAGVYDQDVGARRVVHGAVAIPNQKLRHGVGVNRIFGAAERNKMKCIFRHE